MTSLITLFKFVKWLFVFLLKHPVGKFKYSVKSTNYKLLVNPKWYVKYVKYIKNEPPKLLDQVRGKIRLKHYSIRTEQAYVDWIKRFILHFDKQHPKDLGAAQVEQFLTHLAVVGKVSASTQNQAKSALLFLYKEILGSELPWLDDVEQAKTSKRLPVVLTQQEVQAILSQLSGTHHLVVSMLYGTGMRILEGLRLRVKDIDFARKEILIRDGKGYKDRVTMLPLSLVIPLQAHLAQVKMLHEKDLAQGYGAVYMPFALGKNTHMQRAIGLGNMCFHRASCRLTRAV